MVDEIAIADNPYNIPDTGNLLSVDTTSSPVPMEPSLAQYRTKLAQAALTSAGIRQTYEQTVRDMLEGREEDLRQRTAKEIDFKKEMAKQKAIAEVASKNGPLTEDQANFIRDTISSLISPTDTKSVFEEYYSIDYLKSLEETGNLFPSAVTDAKKEIPKTYQEIKSKADDAIAKRAVAVTLYQNAAGIAKDQSWPGYIADQAKSFLTGGLYDEVKLRGQVEEVSKLYGLLGTNVNEQLDYLYTLPFPVFKDKLISIYNKLTEDNPSLAVQFLSAAVGRSTNETRLQNLFSVLNLSTLAGIGIVGARAIKGGARSVELAEDAAKAFKDVVKSSEKSDFTGVAKAEATGDVEKAAVKNVAETLSKSLRGEDDIVKEALDALPTMLKQDRDVITGNYLDSLLHRDLTLKIRDSYNYTIERLQKILLNIPRVDRLPGVFNLEKVTEAVKEDVKSLYKGLENSILDVSNPFRNPVSNTYSVNVFIGKPGGSLFFDKNTAKNFAELHGLSNYKIMSRNTGPGHMIVMSKNIDETAPFIREALIETKGSVSPRSWLDDFLGGYIGKFRTSEDTVSEAHRLNRKAATYPVAAIQSLIKDESKYIRDLVKGVVKNDPITGEPLAKPFKYPMLSGKKKNRFKDWERVVRSARNITDEDGLPGNTFRTVGDLQDFYMKTIGRLPDDVETEAYFAFSRLLELDRTLRNLDLYRFKARLGTEQHSFSSKTVNGELVKSPFFEGIIQKEWPGGEDNILIAINKYKYESVAQLGTIAPQKLKLYKKGLEEGRFQVIRIYDPEARPLNGYGRVKNERIRYVLTDTVESKPLSWEQVPRRGGGHFEYEYNWYIKQAKIRPEYNGKRFRNWYEGDTTLMPISVRAMGHDIIKKLEEARIMLRDNKLSAAEAYVRKNLPIEWNTFKSWFETTRGPDGKLVEPLLDPHEPFHLVQNGRSIVDTVGDELERNHVNFKNGLKEGSDARQYQVQFTNERNAHDLITINNRGSKYNPIYEIEPAKLIDPIPSMSRAINRITKSLFLNDYKLYGVESWLQEAKKFMKKPDEVDSAPWWHFHNPDWKPGIPLEELNRLEGNRAKIQQLVGIPSQTDTFLHSVTQKMADYIYEGLGPKFSVVPLNLLSKLSNPIPFIRSAVLHANLGFFSIPQLLVQAQTYTNIYAIAGARYANAGTYGAYLTLLSKVNRNPNILKKLDEMASSGLKIPGVSHWKPGELSESIRLMEEAGFAHVGGEHILQDTMLNPKLIETGGKSFLDWGLMFFHGGERSVRWGAWHTAYREFRDLNPTGRITNADKLKIIDRADLLAANMTRASSSALHSGVLSIPMQFMSYQMRVAEQFFGKRFGETTLERARIRARLMTYYGAMYGVPTSLGVTAFPFGDFIRRSELERSVFTGEPYVVGDNFIQTLIMEGIPSMLAAIVTGGGDYQKGNFYNIGDRLGIKGLDLPKEILYGDEPLLSILGGAAGSKMGDILAAIHPFYEYMLGHLRDEDKSYPLQMSDVYDIAKITSEGNNILRTLTAIETSKWFSKKGYFLEDGISTPSALFMHITGLQPQSVSDLYLRSWTRKDRVELQKKALQAAVLEYRKGLKSVDDPDEAKRYFTRAFATLRMAGFPEERMHQLISRALSGNFSSLVDQMDWNELKDSSGKDIPSAAKTYSRQQRLRQLRGNQ